MQATSGVAADGIVGVLQFAVDGLTTRQNAIADNLANSQTPGYTATEVSFEDSLAAALAAPDGAPAPAAAVTSAPSADRPATNGNNVDLGNQLADAQRTTLAYQTMTELLQSQFGLIQDATKA